PDLTDLKQCIDHAHCDQQNASCVCDDGYYKASTTHCDQSKSLNDTCEPTLNDTAQCENPRASCLKPSGYSHAACVCGDDFYLSQDKSDCLIQVAAASQRVQRQRLHRVRPPPISHLLLPLTISGNHAVGAAGVRYSRAFCCCLDVNKPEKGFGLFVMEIFVCRMYVLLLDSCSPVGFMFSCGIQVLLWGSGSSVVCMFSCGIQVLLWDSGSFVGFRFSCGIQVLL
ncbi:hypothetical protein BaRGS_00022173, partial [Batillaria attramentaria]